MSSNGLERSHEGPAQAETAGKSLVEIPWRNQALSNEAERLREQRHLKAVQHETLYFPIYGNRRLTDALVNVPRSSYDIRRGPGGATELDDRHEMWWIHGMSDEAALAAGKVFGKLRGDDG